MKAPRYTEEFKKEAVKQVTERGFTRKDVASRLDISVGSLMNWIKKYAGDGPNGNTQKDKDLEIAKLKAENARLKEERDILKKAAAFFANHPE
jgi:transposase